MKKIIRKFWGVALVVMMMSSLLIATVPASAGNYAFSDSLTLPNNVAGDITLAPGSSQYSYSAAVTVLVVDGVDGLVETVTFTYVDQDGNAGNTGTAVVPVGAAVGTAVAITLAGTDTGIRDITAATEAAAADSDATAGVFTFRGSDGVTVMGTVTFAAGVPGYADGAVNVVSSFSIIDVAKSGDVIYAIGLLAPVNTYSLYKSADGGTTWAAMPAALAAMTAPTYIAVAPDDPLTVAIVDNLALDAVYLSTNGGATFAALNALAAGATINSIDISPLSTARYIVVGGNTAPTTEYLVTWTLGGFTWTALPAIPAFAGVVVDNIVAVKYVPTFASEEDLMVVTEGVNSDMTLHIYSYPSAYNGWDSVSVDPSYPKILEANASLAVNRAVIELDETFFALSNEIGFVGASITSLATEIGGVYSVAGIGTQIFTTAGVNSLAWDGINLMVAPYQLAAGAITIYRSSTATTAAPVFSLSTAVKTPGTGTLPLVVFAGADGYAFSRGANSAIARTTDLGRSFNGVKLVNQNFNNMIDFWISADASVMYAITADAVTTTNALWRKNAGVWERILIFTGASYSANWLVRSSNTDPTAVFLAKKGARNIAYSLDNGDYTWTTRFSQQNIADLAVMSAGTVYYVSDTGAAGAAFRGTVSVSAIAWTNLGSTGRGYNITLAGDGFVVGGAIGAVYYYNGTTLAAAGAFGAGNVVVTASGTATGDTIYAASAAGVAGSGSWVIGTSTAWTTLTAAVPFTGVAYANGVAYAYNDAADNLYRYIPGAAADVIASVGAPAFTQVNMVNALQISTSNTLWARNSATAPDTIQSFTEFLLLATPSLSYPIAGTIIPVNSLNGATNPFIFQWAAPAGVTAPLAGWTYTVNVFFDAAGTIAVPPALAGTNTGIAVTNISSNIWGAGAASPFVAGETYYWRVNIDGPITSSTTAMETFTVQQLEAVVPVIDSPPNGSNVASLTPAFSWGPISGVTKYEFQIAKEPEFALMVYTANSSTSSAALPVATQLEDGETYFWRVRAIEPVVGEWSQVGIFTVAVPVTPPVTVTPTVTATTTTTVITTPTIIIPTTTQAPVEKISPAYIWAIIIIGAVLVIAVIVLIVRTRRTV